MKLIFASHFSPGSFSKYSWNTFWLFLGRFANMVLAFVAGIVMIRYLGPQDFGSLSYITSFVLIFSPVISLGSNVILTRELVKIPSSQDILLGSAFFLNFFGTLLFLFLIVFGGFFINTSGTERQLLILISLSQVFRLFYTLEFYFQAEVKSKYIAIVHFLGILIQSVCQIALVFMKAPLVFFGIAYLLNTLSISGFFMMYYHRQGGSVWRWSCRADFVKSLFFDSWPLLLAGLATTVYLQIDQLMIRSMLDLSATGIYATGVKFCTVWYFIPKLISQSLFPAIVKIKQESQGKYLQRMQELFDFITFIGILLTLAIAPFGRIFARTLFGTAFTDSGWIISIYMLSNVFVFIGEVSYRYFLVENKQRLLFFRSVFGAVINVCLNLFFIPKWGINGAAYATVISYVLIYYVSHLFFPSTRPIFIMQTKSLCGYRLFFYLKDFSKGILVRDCSGGGIR